MSTQPKRVPSFDRGRIRAGDPDALVKALETLTRAVNELYHQQAVSRTTWVEGEQGQLTATRDVAIDPPGGFTVGNVAEITAAGRAALGTAAVGQVVAFLGGSYTSTGASVIHAGILIAQALTGANGDTLFQAHAALGGGVLGGSITTQSNSETVDDVATLFLFEPTITKGTDTVPRAATLIIEGAPTEGTLNAALLVKSGDVTLQSGAFTMQETTTPTAITNYGKLYTKTDNKLYFQDGAGTEHEVAFV